MNELEKAYNGIEDAIGSLDYEGNYDVDTPRESLEYIKIYINNLQSKIDKAIEYVNKHCVNEKISKEVGYKCYTIADTNELEKIIKILGDDK